MSLESLPSQAPDEPSYELPEFEQWQGEPPVELRQRIIESTKNFTKSWLEMNKIYWPATTGLTVLDQLLRHDVISLEPLVDMLPLSLQTQFASSDIAYAITVGSFLLAGGLAKAWPKLREQLKSNPHVLQQPA